MRAHACDPTATSNEPTHSPTHKSYLHIVADTPASSNIPLHAQDIGVRNAVPPPVLLHLPYLTCVCARVRACMIEGVFLREMGKR